MAAAVVDVESLFTDVGQVQKALERLDVHKDANEIYELLETHSFRTDRVQFVTSQLLYTLRVRNGLFEDDYNDEDHNGVDNHSVISISDDSSLDGMKDCDIKCENLLYSLSPEYEIPQMNDSEALDLTVPNDQNVSVSENSKEKEGEHSNATSHNDSFEPEVKNSNASPNYSLEPEDGTSKCLLNTYLRELDHFAVSVENVEKETEAAIATILDGFETGSGINMTDNDETKSQGAEESNYPAEQIDFLYDVNNNDPNNNTEYEVPLEEVERERGSKLTVEEPDESDLEFQDQDDIRAKLLAEAKLIHRIVPKQNLEQIYSYLEANLDNKSRLQIVMQEFLKMELLPETHAVPSESAQETNALYNEISYEGTDTSSGNAVPGLNSKPQPSTSKDYTKDSTLEIDPCASSNVMEPESELKLLPTAICDSVDSDSKMLNRDDVNHSTNTSLVLENSSDRLSELPGTSAVEQIPIKTSEQGVQIDDDYDEEIDILTIHVNDETSHNKKNAYNEIPIINTIGHMLPPPEQSQRNPRSLLKKRQKIANAKAIPKIAPAMICKNKNKGDRKKKIPHLNDAGAKAIPKIAPSMIFKNKNKGDKKKKIQSTFPCLNDARLCNLEKKTPLKNILPDDNKNKIKRVTFKLPADDRLIPDRKKNVKRMTFNIPADNIRPPDDRHLPDRKEKVKRVTFPVDNIRPLHVPLWDDDSGDDSDDSLLLSHKRYTQSNTAKKMKRLNEIFQKETVDDSDDDALLLGHKPYTQSNTDKFIENLTQMKDLTDRLERKRKSDDAVDSSPDKNRKIGETSINIPEPELNADQIRYKLTLLEMFPDADPNFLFEMCRKIFDEVAFDDLINRMLQKNYPVRDLPERMPAENLDDPQPGPSRSAKDKTEDIEAQYKILLAILPNADPSYLRQQCENLIGDENKMKAFVSDALENKVYPTKEEYIKRQEALALQKKYTEQFSVEAFLEIIPNPFKYFYEEKVNTEAGFNIVLPYLKSRYKRIRQSDICNELKRNNYSLARTCDRLDQFYGLSRKSKRGEYECRMLEEVNAPFLQEVAFIENKNKIRKFLEDKKRLKEKKFEEARALGDLMECGCCFDNEVLLEDIATCNDGHIFCKECIRKFAEVKIGDGATVFPCLSDCGSEFSLKTLQGLLKPSIFSRMLQRKQLEEVKAAGIEDLESCPFCDFASIPPRGDKIFKCLNPDCMRESCRLCKEPNHIPLRCEEVEKPAEVKARTYIEDRMTEALVRTCWKCSKKFIKEDGCNKMTCTCGAMMCYICRKPVKDYTHFNGEGGDAFHKCPLYSNNDVVNVNPVIEEAEKAKEEVRAMNPQINLKHDPTANLPEPAPPQAGRPRPPPIFDAGLILGPFLQQDFPFVNRQRQNYFNIPENQVHANNVRLDRRRHYLLERLRRAQDRARIRENNVFQFHRNDVPMAYQLGNNLAAQIENNIRVAAQHINELHMAERVVDNILAPAQGGNNIRMAAQIENNGRENNVRVAAQHVNDLRMAARVVDNVHVPAQGGNNIRMAAQIENNARENNVRVAAQHVNDVHMAAHVGDNVHVPAQGGNNIRMAAQIENNAPENNVRVAAQHANDVRMAAQVGNNVHVPAEGGNIRLAAQIENNVRVAAQHVNDVRMAAQGGNNVRLAAQDGNNVRMVAQGIVRVPEHHGNDDYIVRQHLHCVPRAFQLGNNVHLAARHESNVRVAAAQPVNDVRMAAQHGNNVRVERRNRIYVNPQHSNNVHLVGQQGNNVQVNDNYIFTAAQHENNGQVHRNNVRAAAQHGNNIQVNRNNLRMAVQVVAGPVNIQPARRYPDVLYANQYEPQRPGPYARYDPALAGEIVGVNRPLVQPVIVERRVQVPAQPLFNELPPAQPVIQEPADLLPPYAREP